MNQPDHSQKVGIIVPTIGGRPEYLPEALKSIRMAGDAYVILVGRAGFDASEFAAQGLIDLYLDEQGPNLAEKINFGFTSLPPEIKYINWLGDDDLLTPGSLEIAKQRLDAPDRPVLVYGGCEYIDPKGKPIFINKSGRWAVPLLRFGPQLIPQPGSLYRRDAFERIGGLKSDFGWAFDFELFYSLSEVGKAAYLPNVLSSFRWHPGSLSVNRRLESVREASDVRKSHLPKIVRTFSELWELPVRILTYLAGLRVSKKINLRFPS
jgi:glycosyltransferase involved in cell wall biosynthesis